MSEKNLDNRNRWRNKTVSFRVSPEEGQTIDEFVRLSGLSKQEYITRKLTNHDVEVMPSPRVYKALKEDFAKVCNELKRIEAGRQIDKDLLEVLKMMCDILGGIKGEQDVLHK